MKGKLVLVCLRWARGRVGGRFPMVPSKEASGPGEAVWMDGMFLQTSQMHILPPRDFGSSLLVPNSLNYPRLLWKFQDVPGAPHSVFHSSQDHQPTPAAFQHLPPCTLASFFPPSFLIMEEHGPRKDPVSRFWGIWVNSDAGKLSSGTPGWYIVQLFKNKRVKADTLLQLRHKSSISYLSGMTGLLIRSNRHLKCHMHAQLHRCTEKS